MEISLKTRQDIENYASKLVILNLEQPKNLINTLFMDSLDFDSLFNESMINLNSNNKVNEFKYNSSSGISFIILRKV